MKKIIRRPFATILALSTCLGLYACWGSSSDSVGVNVYPITAILLDPISCEPNSEDVVDCRYIYVATNGGGIFRSDDFGETWSAANNGLLEFNVTDMAMDFTIRDPEDDKIDPGENPPYLYAGTENTGAYRSFDGGFNWTIMNASISEITDMAVDANSCQSPPCLDIYITSQESGVWVTKTSGLSWTQINEDLEETTVTVIEVFSYIGMPSLLYVGTEEGSLYTYNHVLEAWEKLDPGLSGITNASPLDIAINPFNPEDMYVGTSGGEFQSLGGVFRSLDGGLTWNKVEIPNDQDFSVKVLTFCIQIEPQCPPLLADPAGEELKDERQPDTLYAGVFGLSRTFFPVETIWENIDLGGQIQQGNNTTALAIDNVRHTAIYAGTREGFIVKSLDAGETWVRLDPES